MSVAENGQPVPEKVTHYIIHRQGLWLGVILTFVAGFVWGFVAAYWVGLL